MDKKVLAGLLSVAVVLVVGYFAFFNKSNELSNTNNSNSGQTSDEVTDSGKKMSFSDFLKQGGSYMCTVNQYVEDIESKGTVYIDGENIRGTFATSVSGMNVNSELLVTGGFTYTWSSMMPGVGFKAPVIMQDQKDLNTGTSGQYSFNSEQIGDYNCEPWSADKSKFSIPTGIVFTEVKQ